MFGLVLKKTHREVLRLWGEEEHAWRANEAALHKLLDEKDTLINSTERKKVLDDLELALNLVQAYQRALSMVSASDPNIIKANALLEKWGKHGDPHATYLGATATPPPATYSEFKLDSTSIKSRLEQKEEFYGEEAYGSATVRIEAVPIEEEDKEPGYTRARIRFVDVEEDPVVDPADPGPYQQ